MKNKKKKLHWVKLDNAAKIYPAARRKNWSNLFRQSVTFHFGFVGWSVYPLCVLLLFGGLLIYLAINSSACEIIERKLFF